MDDKRTQVLDFLFMLLLPESLPLLSCPRLEINQNILQLITCFDEMIWILILMSYLTIISINCYLINDWKHRIFLAIDYFILSLGKGMTTENI